MKGKIILFLFALPFFGVGAWMGHTVGSHMFDAWQMQSWIAVDATLQDAGYTTHAGDDSDSYEAYAEYSYDYAGKTYHGSRVAIAAGADNIGDDQQELGRRLQNALAQGLPVTAFVNPGNPAEAIIERRLRWGLIGFKSIFFFVFGGAGLGMIIFAFRAPRKRDHAEPKYADKPWLANAGWQTESIRSNSKSAMHVVWGIAVFWNLVSAPLPFVVYREITEKSNLPAAFGLLFPLVGAGLLLWAIRRTLEWRRFGPAPVILDPFPGSVGGHVGGTIDVRLPYDPNARFTLTLVSLQSYVSGTGKNRSRRERAKWQDTVVAKATTGTKGTRLSFRFDVPEDLPESDADTSEDTYYIWRLNLSAKLPGTDIDRDYEIPVYATGEHSRRLSELSMQAANDQQRQIDLASIRDRVSIRSDINGKSILFPMGRNLAGGLGGLVFGGIFAAAGGWMLISEELWFMGGIFGLVGMLIAVFSLYLMFNSLEVIRHGGNIRSVRRILGIPVRRAELRMAEFLHFEKKASSKTQSGSKHVIQYALAAVDRSGRHVTIGEGFKGANEAQAAMAFMTRELGLVAAQTSAAKAPNFGNTNLLAAD